MRNITEILENIIKINKTLIKELGNKLTIASNSEEKSTIKRHIKNSYEEIEKHRKLISEISKFKFKDKKNGKIHRKNK